ncbi:MAG TPA: phosphate-starvation-inducible PsiE family protein, partial [Thermoanaerobaculia bacterium]
HDIVNVLDRILLVLMIIELLYTVKVSFREHALIPEPFLIVGLIAVTRRILIVTAQFAVFLEKPNDPAFRNAMLELALLTVMVVALVLSLLMLRKRAATPLPDRA